MPLRVINIIPQNMSAETNFDSEPSITVNPANTQEIVISTFTPDTGMVVTRGTYFFSTDGGANWTINNIVPGGTALLPTGDISVRFGGSTGVLYAGILRGDNGNLAILRTGDFAGAAAMDILVDRPTDDQPWVETATVAGQDRVYISSNDTSQRPNGSTASVDFSLDAATAAAPAGFTNTARLEPRATAALTGTAGNQDGPSVRVAIHPSGVLYAAYFGWRTFGTTSNTTDIVVCRDDNWASGTTQFQALADTGDLLSGRRLATGVTVASLGTTLGTQRIGSNLSLAVDPRDSQRVYIAWCDGLDTTASPYTLRVRRSDDGGANWSPDLFTKASATNPAIAVNARGTVGLLYQEFATVAGVGRWRTHYVQSVDRFHSTFSDLTLADVIDSSTGASLAVIIGDYVNLLAIGKDFYGVFSAQNAPVRANFPVGITYLRNADWATGTLRAVDNTTAVSPSVDPFFFHDQALAPVGNFAALAVGRLPDARLELWGSDGGGVLFSTWKWTTHPDADWVPLMDFDGEVGALPAAVTELTVAPLPDGRLELWAATANGQLFSTWKTTTDPNGNWSGWADFNAEVGALPAAVTALTVAPLQDGRLELWASTANGGLFSTWKLTTDPNGDWAGWADFNAEVGALPAAVTALTVAPLSDGRLELWASTANGGLFSTWKVNGDPNGNWSGWADFIAEVGTLPAAVTALTVGRLPDARLELWASTANGGLFSTWKTTTDPNGNWSGWADFIAEVGALPAAVTALTVAPLPDGRLELWVSTANGQLFSTWKTTTDPNATWTGVSDFIAEV
jgi:hypothetical protein